MATVIKLKRGTSTPTTSDLANGEVAIDTSAKKFYVNDNGTIKEIGGGGGGGDVTWQSVHQSDGSTVLNVSASEGYFIDTSTIDGGATAPVSLPSSPSVGDKIILVDYKGTSSTNNIEINPNGNKILGSTNNKLVRDDRSGIILVYSGSDVGWVITAGYVEPDDGLVGAPGAPTIGTASLRADGVSIDVPFTAPTDNGGNTITGYTATSSPGGFTGTLSQAGSGTIVVSGLDLSTAYTFTVTATNSIGTGPASAASNSVTTTSETFIQATGGTATDSGDYRIHTFTGDGCFEVTALGVFCCGGTATTSNKVSYLVVGGGGGGGRNHGGGGGAGGLREGKRSDDPYTASPLDAGDGLVVTANPTTYPISIGGGGSAGSPAAAPSGSGSTFSTITSAGGGGGGGRNGRTGGNSGGSGGGGSHGGGGGSGNSPSVSPPQGTSGSGASGLSGGRGGSAVTAGTVTPSAAAGAPTNITGSDITYSSAGGAGGYARGGDASPNAGNRGYGGYGGHSGFGHGQAGGQGVVIIRYKFQSS